MLRELRWTDAGLRSPLRAVTDIEAVIGICADIDSDADIRTDMFGFSCPDAGVLADRDDEARRDDYGADACADEDRYFVASAVAEAIADADDILVADAVASGDTSDEEDVEAYAGHD